MKLKGKEGRGGEGREGREGKGQRGGGSKGTSGAGAGVGRLWPVGAVYLYEVYGQLALKRSEVTRIAGEKTSARHLSTNCIYVLKRQQPSQRLVSWEN